MNVLTIIELYVFAVIATSYGWGMRGTTIGGEKGAMLPGAIIGLALACFSNILIIKENFFIFSAIGACGMYFGGTMTYGETLSISMSKRPAENMKKGLTALFVKGFGWFGGFGGIFSVATLAVCGQFKLYEILCVFAALPASMVLFYLIFNKPHKPLENKYPKIYFSYTRSESWGALIGLFIMCLTTVILKSSTFGISFTLFSAFGGAFGWVIAQLMQVYMKHYADDSKNKFLKLFSVKRRLDSWKAMECILGAFGAIGAVTGFVVGYKDFAFLAGELEKAGGLFSVNTKLTTIVFWVWVALLAIDLVHFFIKPPKNEEELKRNMLNGVIDQITYEKTLAQISQHSKAFKIYQAAAEGCESTLYAALPLFLICCGDVRTASITSFFLVLIVVMQEVFLEKEPFPKAANIIKPASIIVASAVFISQFYFTPSSALTLIMYTVIYEITALYWTIPRNVNNLVKKQNKDTTNTEPEPLSVKQAFKLTLTNPSFYTVHGYFTVCIVAALLIFLL